MPALAAANDDNALLKPHGVQIWTVAAASISPSFRPNRFSTMADSALSRMLRFGEIKTITRDLSAVQAMHEIPKRASFDGIALDGLVDLMHTNRRARG